jgi:DNA-binding transcriptional MerR regulator
MSKLPLVQDSPDIPDKLYFRIGEVSHLLGVEPYVLRYWESEFPSLSPKKSGTGHRLYRRKDVELLLQIKRLLYEKRYTIEGARQSLLEAKSQRVLAPARRSQTRLFEVICSSNPLPEIRGELAALLDMLK